MAYIWPHLCSLISTNITSIHTPTTNNKMQRAMLIPSTVLYSTHFLRLEVFNCVVWEEGEEAWRWSKELLLIYNCPSYWHCDGAECLVLTNCCCVKAGIEIVIFSGSFKPSHSPHCCTPRTRTHSRCNVNIYAICKNLVQRMANFGVDGCSMRWFPRRRGLVLENWQIVCNFIFSLVTAVGAGRRERGRQPHRVAEELHPRQPSHHQHILTIHLKWTSDTDIDALVLSFDMNWTVKTKYRQRSLYLTYFATRLGI